MSQANILLVGATGTIGSTLCEQLSKTGAKFRCFVRDPKTADHIKHLGMDFVIGDIAKPNTLRGALEGIEKVFMCTPTDPTQIELQGNLTWACKEAKVKHLVKISTLGANPNSPLPFAQWHGVTEKRIADLQIPYTFLRPHYFMQNTLMFQPSMKSADAIFTPLSDAKISLVDSNDVAAVACSVLTSAGHENKIYELTGPQALSFKDIAQSFSEFYGRPIEHLTLPYETLESSMKEFGTPDWLAQGTLKLYKFFDTGDAAFVRTTVADITKKQPTQFREFILRHAEYFQA